jgi:medium-chain acyl-[acyl-carrier-protein] hydrolase
MAPVTTTARVRLFCLPYAGGGAAVFRRWPSLVTPDLQIAAIQLPGREHRLAERAFTNIDALVPALIDAIREHLDRPFAIFGHSMGALIAFELTRALRKRGMQQPVRLFLSGHRAPQLPDRRPPLHALGDAEFLDALRELEGTPDEVLAHEELMAIFAPTLRADFQLCETYGWSEDAPLEIPLSVFGGTDDPDVDRHELDAWSETTSAPSSVRMFEGGHLFLQQAHQSVVKAVVDDLR